jgi:hypothetical protein
MLLRLRTAPNAIALLCAAALVGWGDFFGYGMFNPRGLRLVVLGSVLVGLGLLIGVRGYRPGAEVAVVAVATLAVWQGIMLVRATDYYGQGQWIHDARFVSIALPTVSAVAVAAPRHVAVWFWRALLAGFVLGAMFVIAATPRPSIDVWYQLQHAASCLPHGCNPYAMHTPASPGVKDGFNYLPMTFVLLTPVHAVFGDVRYAEVAAVVVAALLLRRLAPRQEPSVVPLFLCVPGLFFAVEQAWTEQLLVPLLFAAVWWLHDEPASRRRWLGAGLLLGLALATKQHVWLLLPVAAVTLGLRAAATALVTGAVLTGPWLIADPHAFWGSTVTIFLDLPPRIDSLSLWVHEAAGSRSAAEVAVVLVAYLLVWLSCRDDPRRFLLGAATVLAAFDLMNKQTFFNQWLLVTWLLVAATAVELERLNRPDDHRVLSWREVSIVAREV